MNRFVAPTMALVTLSGCSSTIVRYADGAPHQPAASSSALADAAPPGAIKLGEVELPDFNGPPVSSDDACKLVLREEARTRLGATVVVVAQSAHDVSGRPLKCVASGYATVR